MNTTNRALNRIVLLIIGLVFLALAALTASLVLRPDVGTLWGDAGKTGEEWLAQAWESTRIAGTTLSWLGIGVIAAIVIAIALLAAVLTGIGGRRGRALLRADGAQNELGRVTVTESFASDALKSALAERDEILSVSVTAGESRRTPVMHVAVTPRQNTSPRHVVTVTDQLVSNLATLTGRDIDTYISVHSGLRARLARDQSRLS